MVARIPRRTALLRTAFLLCLVFPEHGLVQAQGPDTARYNPVIRALLSRGMRDLQAENLLRSLVAAAPHRLSGSPGAAKAVLWGAAALVDQGCEHVRQETVMVPHWVRGSTESAVVVGRRPYPLAVCALGGSVGTPPAGITAGVVEVHSFDELRALGPAAKGKIVFFNRPMDPAKVNTFEAYGGAVDQRGRGAVEASRHGGVAALVRSVTTKLDRVPHTGAMGYQDTIPKIPAAAVSTLDADTLSAMLKRTPHLRVTLRMGCRILPDVPSANVMGEIVGSEKPNDVIVVSGHLDCWDEGQGAVDDGAGCAQAIEALRLLQAIGVHPKKTIRAVLFMNEENGDRGGKGYAVDARRLQEHHLGAIESDMGGFAPRGFSVDADSLATLRSYRWRPLFAQLQADEWSTGYSGTDITPLVRTGVPGFGLIVEGQSYFDYHHSANDVLSAVHPRELELGAIAEALLAYLLSEDE
jgi:carboxypeptidase Q